MTTNSSAAGNLYQARMGPNSNTKTPETHNLDAQTSSNCFEKKRRCYTMVNMPRTNYFETCSRFKFLSLNICYVIYVLLWIKYWHIWFEILLVLILFQLKNVPTFPEFWKKEITQHNKSSFVYCMPLPPSEPTNPGLPDFGIPMLTGMVVCDPGPQNQS